MNANNIQQAIDMRYAATSITPELRESIMQNTVNKSNVKIQKSPVRLKPYRLVAAAAILLCALMLSIPVLGAVSRTFNDILADYLSRDLARLLMPLETIGTTKASIEVEGIRYDVISAIADEYNVFLEIEITDISGEARLKEGFTLDGGLWHVSYSGYHTIELSSPKSCRLYQYYSSGKPINHENIELDIHGISWNNATRDSIGVYEGVYVGDDLWANYPWLLSFSADKAPTKQFAPVTVGNKQFFDLCISPFALNLQSDFDILSSPDFSVDVRLTDGQVYTFDHPTEGGNHSYSCVSLEYPYYHNSIFFGQLFDLDSIESVSITLHGETTFLA